MSTETTKNAWQLAANECADHAFDRMATKEDRFGKYSPKGGARWAPKKEKLTWGKFARHFMGFTTIGVGAMSLEDECLWIAIDLDNHVTDVSSNKNLEFALVVRERCKEIGIQCLIEDSDGKGGIHIWIFFSTKIPGSVAHNFAKWLVRDHKGHGLRTAEVFPKSATVQNTPEKCGNYLRVPGKHHKRDHWSVFYGNSEWLTLEESVNAFLDVPTNSPDLIPEVLRQTDSQRQPRQKLEFQNPKDSSHELQLAMEALAYIPSDCHYDEWLSIGMCLHSQGDEYLKLWTDWSSRSNESAVEECAAKWRTFSADGGRTLGTLFKMAEQHGWVRPKKKYAKKEVSQEAKQNAEENDSEPLDPDELPENAVELSLNEQAVNDDVIRILSKPVLSVDSKGLRTIADGQCDIYDHHGRLAKLNVDSQQVKVYRMPLPVLREVISDRCKFFIWSKDPETGEEVPKWERIKNWVCEGIYNRGVWKGIKKLKGVVNCPVMRPDGSIVQISGYDERSGLYVDLQQTFPEIPERPTFDQVAQSIALLRDLVCDFPFKSEAHFSAWLAAVLTPLAREAYSGPTGPVFLFDSNVRGSGKSLLADLVSITVDGREAVRCTLPSNEEESRKRITAFVLNNDRVVLIDNIVGSFGSASLDAALTGTHWKDRLLGVNSVVEAPLQMTWLASGNNVSLAADTSRRVCHIRLESPEENPEDRANFRHPDVRRYARENRPALLAAALTILRGFVAAGRPDQGVPSWGSYEGWSDLVRQAIVWAGLPDPGDTRKELRDSADTESGALRQMLEAVATIDPSANGYTANELIQIIVEHRGSFTKFERETLKDAIEQLCDAPFDKITSRRLGNQLAHVRGRIAGGRKFNFRIRKGNRLWFAITTDAQQTDEPIFGQCAENASSPTTEFEFQA